MATIVAVSPSGGERVQIAFEERVRVRAYYIWLQRMRSGAPPHGNDLNDWLQAEWDEIQSQGREGNGQSH